MQALRMAQASEHRVDRRIVGQLAAARGQHHEQRTLAAGAHDMLQQVRRGGVAPLDIVEHQQRRPGQHALRHGGEQAFARRRCGRVVCRRR